MTVSITYFVHGTTTDNEKNLATGWLHGKLSLLGLEQSKELEKLTSEMQFDIVFCSDLKRAIDTSNLAFSQKYKIIEDSRLRECNYGDLDGTNTSFKSDLKQYIEKPFPNGESYKDVESRISSFLNFLKKNHDQKSIAIVAHQAPQLVLDVLITGKTWEQAFDEDWRKTKNWKPGWKYDLG